MPDLPFDIPPSLVSYLEQYQSAPEKTTKRLEQQLQKRGADAVGHFLLAWFYHQQELHEQAVDSALKAKTYAPGSPFFEKLHYFFSHPKLFDAWRVTAKSLKKKDNGYGASLGSSPLLDLDHLITMLSDVESNRIKYDLNTDSESSFSKEDLDDVEDIVSETLAKIHEKQGKLQAAINTYQKLKVNKAEKKDFYEEQIERLKKLQKDQEEQGS